MYRTNLRGMVYEFQSIKEVLAKSSEIKSGDGLAGVAARTMMERVAARMVLSELTVQDITEHPVVDYEKDAVTRMILDHLDRREYQKWKSVPLGELREWILDSETSGDAVQQAARGLTSEVIAGVSKLMGNLDLAYAGNKLKVTKTANTTIGEDGVLACRLQPNHPVDDPAGIRASALEGLSYGMGDALIGVNPAIDTAESTAAIWHVLTELKEQYQIPTQMCCLSHIRTQMEVLAAGKANADLCFQSIAGSQKALESFGVTTRILQEARELFDKEGSAAGPNRMYFETGQGSELSSEANEDADQQTMECRCYGLARCFDPFLVNTVVGFMGPEYIYDSPQLLRAGLEDVFCGHMHGLAMGCDVCYTNHMPVNQNDAENLLMLLGAAGVHYVMGLPHADDIMLMYQSTGFQDVAAVREMLGKHPVREFEQWLESRGIWENGRLSRYAGDPTAGCFETAVKERVKLYFMHPKIREMNRI